jgi:hypothetical protein
MTNHHRVLCGPNNDPILSNVGQKWNDRFSVSPPMTRVGHQNPNFLIFWVAINDLILTIVADALRNTGSSFSEKWDSESKFSLLSRVGQHVLVGAGSSRMAGLIP